MFKTGIVSVTFRKKTIDEIIRLAKSSSLECIEVGSDVHAPKEDHENCKRIAALAADSGIEIISYGSYYKLGQYESPEDEFEGYISAAKLLKAKNIRIWAGVRGSADIGPDERTRLTAEARLCARLAAEAGLTMSFEYHGGTLTDGCDSALKLMDDIAADNVSLYWQPNQYKDTDFNTSTLKRVLPFVSNVHVFAWDARGGSCLRFPLAVHEAAWHEYLDILSSDTKEHALLMEFVKDDSDAHFIEDAKTLTEWRNCYV